MNLAIFMTLVYRYMSFFEYNSCLWYFKTNIIIAIANCNHKSSVIFKTRRNINNFAVTFVYFQRASSTVKSFLKNGKLKKKVVKFSLLATVKRNIFSVKTILIIYLVCVFSKVPKIFLTNIYTLRKVIRLGELLFYLLLMSDRHKFQCSLATVHLNALFSIEIFTESDESRVEQSGSRSRNICLKFFDPIIGNM